MKIHLERHGGFTGIPLKISLDTERLDPAEGRALLDLVASSGFFSLPEKLPQAGPGADRFQYKITIEDAGSRHTLEAGESSLSPALQAMVQQILVHRR